MPASRSTTERLAHARKARGPRAAVPAVAVGLAYCALALVAYWPVSPVSSSKIIGCGCGDYAQESWFLAWPAFAVTHGHSLFSSTWIAYPKGVNLAANTSMPLLGLLTSPLTLGISPVASYNFLLRAGFAASAGAMYFVLRRWGASRPAAFLGGLLYGFSPYVVGEGLGHVFLSFVPLPPLIFLVAEELFVSQRHSQRRSGLALGLLVALQYYISQEVLATTLLMVAVAAAVVAAGNRRVVHEHLARAWEGVCWAFGLAAVLCGYSIAFFFVGSQHMVGASHSPASLDPYHADLFSLVVPTSTQLFSSTRLADFGNRLTGFNITETGAYLGIPLLILLAVIVVRCFGDRRIRLALGLAAVAFILALGSHLSVLGVRTAIPLPFAALQHVPLLQGALAGRFSLYEQLFVAVALAFGLDGLRVNRRRTLAVFGVAAFCLLPLVPRFPYPEASTGVPTYFTAGGGAARQIPTGSLVLTYPYPFTPDVQAMLWQAEAGMHFKIVGGQAATPNRHGDAESAPATLPPRAVEALFLDAMNGTRRIPARVLPAPRAVVSAIRVFCLRYDVSTVVVDPIGLRPGLVISYLTAALGRPPAETGGVDVWVHASQDAASATP